MREIFCLKEKERDYASRHFTFSSFSKDAEGQMKSIDRVGIFFFDNNDCSIICKFKQRRGMEIKKPVIVEKDPEEVAISKNEDISDK